VAEVTVDRFGVERLRCAGKIVRTLKKAPNTCELDIWNLSRDTRGAIEELRPNKNSKRGIPVKVRLGYEGQPLTQVWLGDLRTAISLHEPPEWRTLLSSGDGEKAIRESRIAQAFGARTPIDVALRAVVKKLQEYLGGNATITQTQLSSLISDVKMKGVGKLLAGGVVLYGSTANVLSDFCEAAGLEWSIQDGAIQIVNRGKALRTTAILVQGEAVDVPSAEKQGTNLLGAPDVDAEGVVSFRMLISPDAIPGAVVDLKSERLQGFHRIEKTITEFDTFDPNVWSIQVEAKRYG
jgi:hypothetical protein